MKVSLFLSWSNFSLNLHHICTVPSSDLFLKQPTSKSLLLCWCIFCLKPTGSPHAHSWTNRWIRWQILLLGRSVWGQHRITAVQYHDVSSPCFNTTDQLFQNSRGWKEITPPVHKTYMVKLDPECDIRENFDTNECPNIFVSIARIGRFDCWTLVCCISLSLSVVFFACFCV